MEKVQGEFTEKEKQEIVTEFLPKIKSWAVRMKSRLPDSVDVDDLFSAASMGLVESLEKYDKSRNIAFGTYAERRIKGAMLDSLRGLDYLPRNLRVRMKQLESEATQLAVKLGRKPTAVEIVEHTGYDEDDVYRLLGMIESESVLSLDKKVSEDDDVSLIDFIRSEFLGPEDELMKSRLSERLASEIDKLTDKERKVVSLYYYEELTMKEIAEVLDLTESRVSQIHLVVVQKLQRRLKDII